ncbi:NAD(P)-dependent oxidoreductase [Roseicyclus mahoneyensis]|uniref:3-hydroxyisobutyrate dehydrogenase n=1 Tax=Roseicyclus mahoneyensis TaxID=164332 RepID=A0A316GET9_9RHOB|nr:NAD(P)-dependent oxidoreductase [Roseicyclus mahoneyensis]PWK59511.1 3-hydroxyisobutyrate dehydrogenase [Roseicyclus mahoneyensis]
MDRIGVIGLGRMGAAMAMRLSVQGVPVTGWTRSGRTVPGVTQAPDLAALLAASDVMILSLFDDDAVGAMLDALAPFDLSGKLVVETSTVTPRTLAARVDRLGAAGAALVDAPVSGGPELVAQGACGFFIGGPPEAAVRAQAALTPLSTRIFHVGPLGTGLVMKTVNNALMQTYTAGLVEQLRVAARAGLPLETALTILCGGPAGLPMVRDRVPRILGQDTSVGFPVRGVAKDNAVFRRVAAEAGVATPTLDAFADILADVIEAGLSDADIAAVMSRAYHDA